jgi:RNA polymerase sigma-70 factor, ECF subfamily
MTAKGRSRPDSAAELEAAFLGCERRLGKYLIQMVGDRALAEDLLQETFHDAFRARGQFAELRNPEAWLFGIARNLALGSLRRRRRFGEAFRRLTQATKRSHTEQDALEIRDVLERLLTPEDRSLVLLSYLHGFTATELAAMTGRSPAAVRQRLARARAKVLADAGPGDRFS